MHILCSITFFQKIMSFMKNVEKYGTAGQATDNNTIWHVCFASWVTKAKETHSEYVILVPFLWQHWSCEHASKSCYMYIASLVGLSSLCYQLQMVPMSYSLKGIF